MVPQRDAAGPVWRHPRPSIWVAEWLRNEVRAEGLAGGTIDRTAADSPACGHSVLANGRDPRRAAKTTLKVPRHLVVHASLYMSHAT
jgi:hypothetical protein